MKTKQDLFKEYPVITFTMEDLQDRGYDITYLTETDMENLANRIGEVLLDYYYWDILDLVCSARNIKKINED